MVSALLVAVLGGTVGGDTVGGNAGWVGSIVEGGAVGGDTVGGGALVGSATRKVALLKASMLRVALGCQGQHFGWQH